MRYRAILFSVIAGLAGHDAAAAQAPAGPFAVKSCDEPKSPIGSLPKALGTASFRMSKDGKPDTTSLAVHKILGLSVAGFRSAVARQLSACRFDVAKSGLSQPVVVSIQVSTNEDGVDVGPATASVDNGAPLAVEPFTLPRDTMPFAVDDRRVEELPRPLNCSAQTRAPTVIHASGATPAQARADAQEQMRVANLQYSATNAGTLTAIVRVGIDGKPGSQIRVISVSNPGALQSLGDRMGACRYVPGRILGVAVPTLFQMTVP